MPGLRAAPFRCLSQVSLAEGGRPFTCNLAALSGLGQLRTLEFAVTKDLGLPLSVKQVRCAGGPRPGNGLRAWPNMCALTALAPCVRYRLPECAALELLTHRPFAILIFSLPPRPRSMLALAWPTLTSLSISVMGKPEVAPEALGLLDNFSRLSSLSLFAPLDYSVWVPAMA